MGASFSLFDYILLGIGLYVLYAGITGKGRMYNVENLKEGMEQKFKSTMRKLYIGLGIVMSLNAGASLLKSGFYELKEITPATDTVKATYDWALQNGKSLGAFSFLTPTALDIITYVLLGLSLVLIVLMIIGIRKMTNKPVPGSQNQSGAKSAQAANQAGHALPVSAFEFDEPTDAEDPSDKKA